MVRRWAAAVILSNRGGLFNVWAVRFDPLANQQVGEPFPVTHFDGPGETIYPLAGSMDIGVSPDQLVIPVVNPTGHVSLLEKLGQDIARPTWLWFALLITMAVLPMLLVDVLPWKMRARPR